MKQLIYHTHIRNRATAYIQDQHDQALAVEIEDIGRDGIGITCNRLNLERIVNNLTGLSPKNPTVRNVAFQLNSDCEKLEAKCNIVYCRRTSKENYLLKLEFSEISDKDMLSLDAYVAGKLEEKYADTRAVA